MDGIWLTGRYVALIAYIDDHVTEYHLVKSENSRGWTCLMRRIAPPDALVCDDGGMAKAVREMAEDTDAKMRLLCLLPGKKSTTARPRTQTGMDLYALAKSLPHVKANAEAAEWMASFRR